MNIKKIIDELYKDFSPTMAMINTLYNVNMEFDDARKCVHAIYMKRGYVPATEFVDMLSGFDLISLLGRSTLKSFLTTLENVNIKKKQEKKLAQKIRRNKK